MAQNILTILLTVTIFSMAQSTLAPVATSYIYRSDHGGPGNLIKLGHGYEQPQIYAPVALVQPVKYQDYVEPAPLPYIAAKPIVVEDAEDDDDSYESSEEDSNDGGYGHSYEKGDGSDYGEKHHKAHGGEGHKGYLSKGHHAKGQSGHYGKEHNEGYYDEAKGEKGAHHDEADAYGKHYESGENYKGGDHGHKSHYSKGENIDGYHKVFHKDEYKKDHDFYDVVDNSGNYKKYGNGHEHHDAEKGGFQKGGHHDSGFNKGDFGKAGFHSKGHYDDSDAGHSAEKGYDSNFKHHEDYGKAGGSGYKKGYGYSDGGYGDKY